jgi:hypothetical protein
VRNVPRGNSVSVRAGSVRRGVMQTGVIYARRMPSAIKLELPHRSVYQRQPEHTAVEGDT